MAFIAFDNILGIVRKVRKGDKKNYIVLFFRSLVGGGGKVRVYFLDLS